MSTSTIDAADAKVPDTVPLARTRDAAFVLPAREPGPRGTAQGALRELLSLVARRSESYAWRYDADDWNFAATDHAMLHGRLDALEPFGIGSGHRVNETESPVRFQVVSPDGSKRTLELSWDSISYDLMSMPPHVKRYPGMVRVGLVGGGICACWAAIYAGLNAAGAETPAGRVVAALSTALRETGLTGHVEIDVHPHHDEDHEDLGWLRAVGDVVWVEQITSIERRRGHGRAGMAELCVLADGENCRIALNPWAQDYPDALRQDELEAFYASMGFRWRRDHVMVREPMAETMVHVAHDVPWQPTPNRCETILSGTRPPEDLTATAFAYPVVEDGQVLLSSSLKPGRDLEPAGGHIEPGEDQDAAVLREGVEEIGAVLTDLTPIGHQRLASRAERPDPWRYPFPVSYQSFFAARIASLGERTAPEECGPPRRRRPRDITHPAHRLLAMRALQVA